MIDVKKFYKNRKGVSLVTVVMLLTVLTLLSVALADMAIQGLIITKRSKNVDFAYYAGESAIENWFSEIKEILKKPDIGRDYPNGFVDITLSGVGTPHSIDNYADWILREYLVGHLPTPLYIDIANVASPVASLSGDQYAEIHLTGIRIGAVKVKTGSTDTIIATVELKASANYFPASTPYQAGNKEIFAKRDFEILIPLSTEGFLTGAIFSLGDFYVSGEGNEYGGGKSAVVNVRGDVNVFGSYAPDYKTTSQHYYGGIYALRNAKLNIDGNAYSRSFIRTGRYGHDILSYVESKFRDNSEIRITKDAIAQCLQVFGANDRIVVYRNAYTFDDVEMNGINSVIAINGSFLGLSIGTKSHDESSAIVNSALVHHFNNEEVFNEAKKSVIVVNGDVILGGGTFKVITQEDKDQGAEGEVGETVGQIEDASVAWYEDGNYPFYKEFGVMVGWNSGDSKIYHEALRSAYSKVSGKMNIFQKWDIKKTFMDINNWLDEIDKARNGDSTVSFDNSNPGRISGYWNHEIAANGRIYQKKINGFKNNPINSEYSQDLYIAGKETGWDFWIDNIFEGNKLKFTEDYWAGIDSITEPDYEKVFLEKYESTTTAPRLDYLNSQLKEYVEQFAERWYEDADTEWRVRDTGKFADILKKIDSNIINWQTRAESNQYVLYFDKNDLGVSSIDINDAFLNYHYSTSGVLDPIDVYSMSAADRGKNYYFIFNKNPNLDLEVSGTFNGIIFTTGRVILKDGADIYGAIISAGGGAYNGDDFVFKFGDIEVRDDTDVKALDNGDLAGIIFKAEAAGQQANIDFYLGKSEDDVIAEAKFLDGSLVPYGEPDVYYLNKAARINLLQKFRENYIDLFDIL